MTRAEIEETMKLITHGKGRPRLRILYVTSPPWGKFEMDPHDKPISQNDITVNSVLRTTNVS